MKKTKLTGAVLSALIGLSAIASLNAETKITAPAIGKGTPKYVFVFIGDGMVLSIGFKIILCVINLV